MMKLAVIAGLAVLLATVAGFTVLNRTRTPRAAC